MLKKVHVVIKEVRSGRIDLRNTFGYSITVKLLPGDKGSTVSLEGYDVLRSSNVWTFDYNCVEDNLISFTFNQTTPFKVEIAKLILPLVWFEKNMVVKESFPMRQNAGEFSEKIWLKIKVHLNEDGKPAFEGKRGKLQVIPKWKKIRHHIRNKSDNTSHVTRSHAPNPQHLLPAQPLIFSPIGEFFNSNPFIGIPPIIGRATDFNTDNETYQDKKDEGSRNEPNAPITNPLKIVPPPSQNIFIERTNGIRPLGQPSVNSYS